MASSVLTSPTKIYPNGQGRFALGSPDGKELLPGQQLTMLLAGSISEKARPSLGIILLCFACQPTNFLHFFALPLMEPTNITAKRFVKRKKRPNGSGATFKMRWLFQSSPNASQPKPLIAHAVGNVIKQ